MFIGIDVGDAKISMGLVNDKGELSFASTFPIESEQNSEKLMLDIVYVIKSISETIPLELFNDRLLGIGIGIQDKLDKNSGGIVQHHNFDLDNSAMQKIVQGYFHIPVFIESLAAATALVENEVGTFKDNINNAGIIAAASLCKGICQ